VAYVPLDTLVLAAPTSGFSREELDGLEAFVLKGGRLVVAEKELECGVVCCPLRNRRGGKRENHAGTVWRRDVSKNLVGH